MKIFLDCGSNLGQAYTYFKDKYGDNYKYILLEPNPNCYRKLVADFGDISNVEIHNKAAYIKDCVKNFRFTDDYSVGGSIIESHNSLYEEKSKQESPVTCIDVVEMIENLSLENEIIVKFDIESSEYDILERMIASKTIFKVNKIYCEFHSQYMNAEDKKEFKLREEKILDFVRHNGIHFEIWH